MNVAAYIVALLALFGLLWATRRVARGDRDRDRKRFEAALACSQCIVEACEIQVGDVIDSDHIASSVVQMGPWVQVVRDDGFTNVYGEHDLVLVYGPHHTPKDTP